MLSNKDTIQIFISNNGENKIKEYNFFIKNENNTASCNALSTSYFYYIILF